MAKNDIVVIEVTKELDPVFHRHIKRIARQLRKADVEEIKAISNSPMEDVIFTSCDRSSRKWIVMKEERISIKDKDAPNAFRSLFIPIAILGVMEYVEKDGIKGVPWMVATDGIKSIGRFIMKNSAKYIGIMLERYKFLFNFVDARNEDSIYWLKKCGFKFEKAMPIGYHHVPFHRFYMGVE